MTLTIASPPSPTLHTAPAPTNMRPACATPPPRGLCCPNCGFDLAPPPHSPVSDPLPDPDDELAKARAHIADLEAQVRALNEKATAAIYRWADYEDELSRLRGALSSPGSLTTGTSAHTSYSSPMASPRILTRQSPNGPNAYGSLDSGRPGTSSGPAKTSPARPSSFFPSLLSPRKSTPNLRVNLSVDSVEDLVDALSREQTLRRTAEDKLRQTGAEVEELSAALFEQANEMVAGERRARAELEDRVRVLEEKDAVRARRLGVLEEAVERMRRVREVLDEQRIREEQRSAEKQRGSVTSQGSYGGRQYDLRSSEDDAKTEPGHTDTKDRDLDPRRLSQDRPPDATSLTGVPTPV